MDSDSHAIVSKNKGDEECGTLLMEFKQEPELILESEYKWMPAKLEDEQEEYFQQLQYNCLKNEQDIKPTIKYEPMEYEDCSNKYIDEDDDGEDDGDDDGNDNGDDGDGEDDDNEFIADDDKDDENINDDNKSSNCQFSTQNLDEESEISQDLDNNIASGCTKPKRHHYCKWEQHIRFICPVCKEIFKTEFICASHIKELHKDLIDKYKSSHYIMHASKAVCKQCNKGLRKDYIILIHTLRHNGHPEDINLWMCNVCQIKLPSRTSLESHIMKQHQPTNISIQKKLTKITFECPLCPAIYNELNQIRYHFIEKHPKEYWEIHTYPCYLCKNNNTDIRFDNIKEFCEHLQEKHDFNDWKSMNFEIFTKNSDEKYYCCTKCFKTFTELDLNKFMQHYLEHVNYCWSCKSCGDRISLKIEHVYHMCEGLFKMFRSRGAAEVTKDKTLSNWKEFEAYIRHVCSFCNQKFQTLQNWQNHLRKSHQLDTLEGLKMKKVPNDSNKLKCNVCNTLIINSSVQLHTHCFQHLPYKPYKCRHCSLAFDNYQMALNHMLQKCKDHDKSIQKFTTHGAHEMICPLCVNIKFSSRDSLWQHYTKKHNDFMDFCTKQLDHTGLVCNICQLKLSDDTNLCRSHVLGHFAQKPHKCLKCSQCFLKMQQCFKHINYHFVKNVSEKSKMYADDDEEAQKDDNEQKIYTAMERATTLQEFVEYINYACPECNVFLTTQELWQDHINENHNFFQDDKIVVKDPADGIYKCIDCRLVIESGRTFRQKHKLTHMPYKSFICKLCCHRCYSLGVLYGHLRRMHFSKGPHKCPICSVTSDTQYERSEHVKNTHPRSQWPATMCVVCYKKVSSMSALKVHMSTHDINRPKFECEYCDAKFVGVKDLNLHKVKHNKSTQEKIETDDDKSNSSKEYDKTKQNSDKNDVVAEDLNNMLRETRSKKRNLNLKSNNGFKKKKKTDMK